MTSNPAASFHKAVVSGLLEILGENWQIPECLELGTWFSDVDRLLGEQFGQIPAEGIAKRVGQCAFITFVQNQGQSMGIATLEFRLQPVLQRIHHGLLLVCEALRESKVLDLQVADTAEAYTLQGVCLPRLMQYLLGGFFQEYFDWASNGKVFLFDLNETPAKGWQLRFAKTPFDH